MQPDDPTLPLSTHLANTLPYIRRHARALTGSQAAGDEYALGALQAVLDDPQAAQAASTLRVGFFRALFTVWNRASFGVAPEEGLTATAQAHLKALTPLSRQALLLHVIEEFSADQIAEIMGKKPAAVEKLLAKARQEMHDSVSGSVMIIEDEAMIAMDLAEIVTELGHSISGTAATHREAVALARAAAPSLILSDIQLADGSSGIQAVDEILQAAGDIPVIFITAFPERLLTGERTEPAFVITKPYSAEQVQSAVSQAMFFRSTAMLDL